MDSFKSFKTSKTSRSDIKDEYYNIENVIKDTAEEIKNSDTPEDLDDYLMDIGYLYYKHYAETQKPVGKNSNFQTKECIDNYIIKEESKSENGKLLYEYSRTIKPLKSLDKMLSSNIFTHICESCNVEKLIDNKNSCCVCPQCGLSETIIYNGDNFVDNSSGMDNVQLYAYKRMSHFEDSINSIQAKEFNKIPDEVMNAVKLEISKSRQSIDEISNETFRLYLKKHKFNKYYENIPSIKYKLQGKSIPKISKESEDKMKIMFMMIQTPFAKHCPEKRKNFLSYTFIIYKFCELLEEDEVLECLPRLLKSRAKLAEQDRIWKAICKELNWEYIPTM